MGLGFCMGVFRLRPYPHMSSCFRQVKVDKIIGKADAHMILNQILDKFQLIRSLSLLLVIILTQSFSIVCAFARTKKIYQYLI